jgi:hypothetical protein
MCVMRDKGHAETQGKLLTVATRTIPRSNLCHLGICELGRRVLFSSSLS